MSRKPVQPEGLGPNLKPLWQRYLVVNERVVVMKVSKENYMYADAELESAYAKTYSSIRRAKRWLEQLAEANFIRSFSGAKDRWPEAEATMGRALWNWQLAMADTVEAVKRCEVRYSELIAADS